MKTELIDIELQDIMPYAMAGHEVYALVPIKGMKVSEVLKLKGRFLIEQEVTKSAKKTSKSTMVDSKEEEIMNRFRSGESPGVIAASMGISIDDVYDVVEM